MSREKTEQEMQNEFLDHIHTLIDYWENENRAPSARQKLEGLAHSILVTLDGCSASLPGYKVSPIMAEGDKEYFIENGEDYYPEDADIAGCLHEKFYSRKPKDE